MGGGMGGNIGGCGWGTGMGVVMQDQGLVGKGNLE